MKKWISLALVLIFLFTLMVGCGKQPQEQPENETKTSTEATKPLAGENLMVESFDDTDETYDGVKIQLADEGITVDGEAISADTSKAVYAANDIVYYESGKDFTYGEGTEKDAHTKEEADAHTVVHITKAGQYVLSGKLSKGQIAVDLGEDAEEDPDAVVTLVLDGVDITCEVAPAVIFYNVYECGSKDEETATKDVDLTAAGARVILANNSENKVNGSYVARIYKPGTVELTEDGTEVADAKKLHKYDAAFYSKMSMRIQGGNKGNGNGKLTIKAANEGLDSELHLTIDGGIIDIESGNDGINTNEDNISVTTINGGKLSILVNGSTGEGDGIDSNGWLVINGGIVLAQGCGFSGDAGIDSDKGIHINGGTVVASGNMLDRIEDGGQTHAVFTMGQSRKDSAIQLRNKDGDIVVSHEITNAYTVLVISSPHMTPGEYTLWDGDTQLQGGAGQNGGMRPGGMQGGFGERPDDMEIPDGMTVPTGERPDKNDGEFPEMQEGMTRPVGGKNDREFSVGDITPVFLVNEGANYFQVVSSDEATIKRPGENAAGVGNGQFAIVEGANYFTVV
ncbi:MAG: carbohydrate-binding domain-containing protein [Clostridia bacterium]|nr:carbohydrate-binding domain-containing protein [Clostridia bacterium]